MDSDSYKYWAFISYSHRDDQVKWPWQRRWGAWLHRALESFRIPANLVGSESPLGTIPKRLVPVFRDRDELPSSANLQDSVREALEQSRTLIVICSPDSARSQWVNEEVLTFKRLNRSNRILALIIRGEPNAEDKPGVPNAEECFCPALQYEWIDGELSTRRAEPVAADARAVGDGPRDAFLKLIAGVLGVSFDTLKRRELQRRNRRLMLASAAALLLTLIVGSLAVAALIGWGRADQLATKNKALATQEKNLRLDTQLRLAEAERDKGLHLCAQGDVDQGCLWLARSLATAPESATELQWSIRINLAAWQRELFTLLPGNDAAWPERDGGELYKNKRIVSPDGQFVVTQPDRKTTELILANRKTGQPIGKPLLHPGRVAYAAFSPDSRILAAGYSQTQGNEIPAQVQLWDTATGKAIGAPVVHPDDRFGQIAHIFFRAGGTRLFTASSDMLYVWDQDGKAIAGPLKYNDARDLLAVSDDGRLVVYDVETRQLVRRRGSFVSPEPDFRLWDVDANRAIGPTLGEIQVAAFSADSRQLATGYGKDLVFQKSTPHIQLWDTATGEKVGPPRMHSDDRQSGGVTNLVFRADGERLFSASRETMYVWDRQGRTIAGPLRRWGDELRASQDGRLLLARSQSGDVRLWDVDSQQTIGQPLGNTVGLGLSADERVVFAGNHCWSIPHRGLLGAPQIHAKEFSGILWLTFSQDSRHVLTADFYNSTARLWDARTGAAIGKPLKNNLGVQSHVVSPDGRWFVTGATSFGEFPKDLELVFWDPIAGKGQHRSLPTFPHGVQSLALSLDGKWLAAVGDMQDGSAGQIFIYDIDKDKVAAGPWLHPKEIPEYKVELFFSPDGRVLLSHNQFQEESILWNRQTGERIGEPLRHEGGATKFTFSPDSRTLVTLGKKIRFWDVATGKPRSLPLDQSEGVQDAAFSPDGKWLATVHEDRAARVWDSATGKRVGLPIVHVQDPFQIRFALDGKLLVTGTLEGAYLWDRETGTQVGPALRPSASLAVSPDGHTIATVAGQEFRLWDVPQPATDDAGRIMRQIEAATGLSLDDQGLVQPLTAEEWQSRRKP